MKRVLLLMLIAGSAISVKVFAGTVASNATSVETLVAQTLQQNPELKFYEAELQSAKAGRRSAGLLGNPELSATVGHRTVRGGGVSDEGLAWTASVLQPFEWPGRIGLRKAIANRDVELAELGLARFKAALVGEVRTLAFGLFAAQEEELAAREVSERFSALREVMVQRDPAGLTPLLETRVIEATELNARRRATEAVLVRQKALLNLNRLRNLPPETDIAISAPDLICSAAPAAAGLLELAVTNNFELRQRAVELAQQGLRVQLARNERFPAISVGPSFSDERAGNEREQVAGIGISLPLPLWNRNAGNIDAAAARQMQAETSLAMLQREIESKVIAAAAVFEAKRHEMTAWRTNSVQHFREAAELADRHYRLGAVPVSTYVELQKQYLEAVESLVETRREALAAAVELELLTGLTPSLIQLNPTQP